MVHLNYFKTLIKRYIYFVHLPFIFYIDLFRISCDENHVYNFLYHKKKIQNI
jgi:hypothetical protein